MSLATLPHRPLRGRDREREQLDGLLSTVRGGASQVLVVRGEMGVGKTALLDGLCDRATGLRVARATPVGSEMELAYAGLHQLCAPVLDRLRRLPAPQAEALEVAFGLRSGAAPDGFLVGLAALTLLSDLAEERPLLCVVDDAQWLDRPSARALGFVARRLAAEPVGLVFAVREPGADQELAGLPELRLHGLGDADARALLASAVAGPLDERVVDRLVAETRGNPLALLELPRGLTPAEMAGGFGVAGGPGGAAMVGRIEESYARRLAALPDDTRLLLLVAAADPLGDPVIVLRAAALLGVGAAASGPAAAAGLVELSGYARFSHPLVRRVVYEAASLPERQRAHGALAEATDPRTDPDRRAWHRGLATAGLDAEVAAELERSAARAQARGGLAAGAAFHSRAAELTPEPADRARRALAAAQSTHEAGAPEAALGMLALAEAGPLAEVDRARAELLRAQIAYVSTRGREAPALLLHAARRLAPLDAALAHETSRDAFLAALSAGSLAPGGTVHTVAEAVLAAPRAAAGTPDGLLAGLALLATDDMAAAAPALRTAVAAEAAAPPSSDPAALQGLRLACVAARALGDAAAWDVLSERQLTLARTAGALSQLPPALVERFSVKLMQGDLPAALSLAAEADAVIDATGAPPSLNRAVWLAAWRGRDDEALGLIDARRREVTRRGEGQWLIATEWLSALRLNGLGRYDEALAAVQDVSGHPLDIGLALFVLPEVVEAAVRSGRRKEALAPARRLRRLADAAGTDWALGLAARSDALLAEGDDADARHREALARLERTGVRSAVARAHLVYGEWLRRERRRAASREHLRRAHELFADVGAEGFAERARRELLATGETVRRRGHASRDDLTAQESEIAQLAAGGQTNPEIAAQLFLSPRTVEWHLGKVFGKLGVASRKELAGALAPR